MRTDRRIAESHLANEFEMSVALSVTLYLSLRLIYLYCLTPLFGVKFEQQVVLSVKRSAKKYQTLCKYEFNPVSSYQVDAFFAYAFL